jgi:hypothetical protein
VDDVDAVTSTVASAPAVFRLWGTTVKKRLVVAAIALAVVAIAVVMATPGTTSYVYAITDGKFTKIGRSVDPERRLRQLQTGSPRELRLEWTAPESDCSESFLHDRLATQRIRGEWFSVDVETVRRACAGRE